MHCLKYATTPAAITPATTPAATRMSLCISLIGTASTKGSAAASLTSTVCTHCCSVAFSNCSNLMQVSASLRIADGPACLWPACHHIQLTHTARLLHQQSTAAPPRSGARSHPVRPVVIPLQPNTRIPKVYFQQEPRNTTDWRPRSRLVKARCTLLCTSGTSSCARQSAAGHDQSAAHHATVTAPVEAASQAVQGSMLCPSCRKSWP